MPVAAPHPCDAPACPHLVPQGVRFCDEHEGSRPGAAPQRGTAHERGYDARWRKARALYLAKHPLCVVCLAADRITPARVVDHITPHRGDPSLFWDEGNWQALCDYTSEHNCHGAKTGAGQ